MGSPGPAGASVPLPPPAFDPFAAVGGMPSQGPAPETISLRLDSAGPVPLPGGGLPDFPDFGTERDAGFEDLATDDSFAPPPPPPDLGFDFGAVDFGDPTGGAGRSEGPGGGPSGGPTAPADFAGVDFADVDLGRPPSHGGDAPPPPLFDDPFADGAFDLPPPPPLDDDVEFDPAAPALPRGPATQRPFPDAASASDALQAIFQVRRRSGEKLGTFPLDSIRQMIASGELGGDDVELSRDGSRWLPPARTPGFGPPVVANLVAPPPTPSRGMSTRLTPVPTATASGTQEMPPPAGPGKLGLLLDKIRSRSGEMGPKQWGVAAGLAFTLVGGGLELATPWGFWFHRAILGADAGAPAVARPEKPTPAPAPQNQAKREALAAAIAKAEEALAARKGAEALESLESVVGEDAVAGGGAQTVRAHALLGVARAMVGKREEAEKAFVLAAEAPGTGKEAILPFARFLLDSGRADEAASRLEKLHEKAKGDLDVAIALGQVQIATGRMLQVDQLVTSLEKSHPAEPRLLFLKGLVSSAAERPDEAVSSFEKALQGAGEEPSPLVQEIRLGLADALSRRADAKGAEAAVQKVLEVDPGHPAALTALARLQLQSGNRAAARASFERAIESVPGFLPAHLGRATVLEEDGDLGVARKALEAALALDGRLVDTWVRYGTVLSRLGEKEGALEALQKAKGLDPKHPRALSAMGAVQFDLGKVDEARSTLEAAIASDGTLAEPWLVLSRIHLAGGDPAASIQAARRAVALEPADADASFLLGLAYQEANSPADALKAYQDALALQPEHPDALEHQGEVYMALNALDPAVKSFEGALRLDPSRTRLLLTIADCQLRSNRWDQAIATLRRASRDRGLEGVSFRLGLAHQEKGRTVDAISFFQAASEEDPADPRPWRQLGYAYKDRNRIGDAVAAFRRYLERSPSADDKAEIEDEIATLRL